MFPIRLNSNKVEPCIEFDEFWIICPRSYRNFGTTQLHLFIDNGTLFTYCFQCCLFCLFVAWKQLIYFYPEPPPDSPNAEQNPEAESTVQKAAVEKSSSSNGKD